MNYRRPIRLILGFYKSFFSATFAITACCVILFGEYGLPILTTLIWLKIATLALVYYFIGSYKKKEFYYYRNLGMSRTILWSTTLLLDLALYLCLFILTYKLRWHTNWKPIAFSSNLI